jgi:hypothetical protein
MNKQAFAVNEVYVRSPGHSPGYKTATVKDAFEWIERENRRGAQVVIRCVSPDGETIGEYPVVRP